MKPKGTIAALAISADVLAAVFCEGAEMPDSRVPPDLFAIVPWSLTTPTPAYLAEMRACGFNVAALVSPEHLDMVRDASLKAIVSDGSCFVDQAEARLSETEIAARVTNLTARVKGHPALFGYYLRDEPSADLYPALARWTAAFAKYTLS